MLRLLPPSLALTVALVLTTTAQAAENVTEFFLDNGMQVVVIEDHRSPAVVHMVWYRAGAADEPPGVSGVAHFLEHLMFKGTDDVESGEFSRIVEDNGGTDNAFTSWDYTGYFQRVAADRLDLMMEMEADRMRDLRFADEEVVTERSVILEERAERVDSSAGGLFNEQMRATLYNNHPYGVPIIGWRHEMEQLDREALIAFYEDHYWPNNAILVVAGDVTPDEVRTLAETHYGPIPANPDIEPRTRPQEPPQIADRRLVLEDERVANPYVARAYLVPAREPGDQRRAAALTMLAEILGGSGQTAVLSRQLQVEEERALYAAAFYDSTSYDASSFNLVNVPVPGVSLQEAEADLDRAIAEFLQDGIDPAQFERIKFQIEAAQIFEEDNLQGLARSYGVALTSGLTVEDVDEWPDVLAAVTIDEVMEEARRLFTDTSSVTGYLMQPSSQPEAAAASSAATRTAAAPTEPAAESEEELQ
jgi:zinc protease